MLRKPKKTMSNQGPSNCAKPVFAVIFWLYAMSMPLTSDAYANITGNNSQNFNPTTSVEDYVTVYSSKTLGLGRFSLGLFLDNAVNTLPYFQDAEDSAGPKRRGYNDLVTTSTATLGYGVTDSIDLGIAIPAVLFQDVKDGDHYHGEYGQKGVTDVRLTSKFHLLQIGGFGFAASVSANLSTIKNSPYEGNERNQNYSTELITDYVLGDFDLAANLGYKFHPAKTKKKEDEPVVAFKNQVLASAAIGYKLPLWNSKLIGEIYSSSPSQSEYDSSLRSTTRAEALAALKIFYDENLTYQFGAGSELRHSTASADWRAYLGVNYTTGTPPLAAEPEAKPEEAVVAPVLDEAKPDEVIVIQDVLFKFNSDEMENDNHQKNIDDLVESLQKGDGFEKLIIEGHTCSLGTDQYNLKLSQRRASRIRKMLIELYHLDGSAIEARGMGESKPIADNATEDGRKLNRRVEFKIYRKTAQEPVTP